MKSQGMDMLPRRVSACLEEKRVAIPLALSIDSQSPEQTKQETRYRAPRIWNVRWNPYQGA